MTLRIDPEQNEVGALKSVADWRGKRVVEIGCGDGRLTQRLARLGARVEATDTDRALIATARRSLPERFRANVRFKVGGAEHIARRDNTFDLAIFAWSL